MNPREARRVCARWPSDLAVAEFSRRGVDPRDLLRLLRTETGQKSASRGTTTKQLKLGNHGTTMLVHVPETLGSRLGALIVLHGAGSSGAAMLPYFTGLSERLGMVVLCPDAQQMDDVASNLDISGVFAKRFVYPRWKFHKDDFPMAALRWALEHLDVDPDRCVLAGLSMGGLACWNLSMRLWQHFAAGIPINGALSMWEAFGSDRRSRYLLKNVSALPMFVIHGGQDDRISAEFDRRSVGELRADGHHALTYVEVPDGSHPLHTLHFEDTGELVAELESWLAVRYRETDPKVVRHRALDSEHGRAHWVSLDRIDSAAGAEVIAERTQDDAVCVQVSGAEVVCLYLTSDRLEPGQPVTVDLNGRTSVIRFEPEIKNVIGTYKEHLDPALTAESIKSMAVPGLRPSSGTMREDYQ